MRSYTSKGRKQNPDAPRLEFEIDGVVFRGDGSVSLLDMSEFARLAAAGVDTDDPRAGAILAEIYLALLGDKEYQRFRGHCRRHGTDAEELMAILGDLTSEEADLPTSRSSDSSDGPPNTPVMSTVVSFSRGTVEQVELPEEEKAGPQERRVVSYG